MITKNEAQKKLKNVTHLSPHDKWVLKSLISTVEMLDKVVVEITNVRKENDKHILQEYLATTITYQKDILVVGV